MRCVIYPRVREQVEKGEGEERFSIPAQREACTRHVRGGGPGTPGTGAQAKFGRG